MKVLISPLGSIPGLVTGAYYALHYSWFGNMDKIITISTSGELSKLCEREIVAELERIESEMGLFVEYERYSLPTDAIRSSGDVVRFRKIILNILKANLDADHQTYLSVAGGDSAMAAASAMAAQVSSPTKTFDILFDSRLEEEMQQRGHIVPLLNMPPARRRFYLKPPPEKVGLVEIPLLSLGERGVDPTRWLSRIFECAVGAYLSTYIDPPYTQIEYNFYPDYLQEGLGEVDILATRQVEGYTEVLLCECRLREDPVPTEWLARLARKRQKVIEKFNSSNPRQVKAWFVTVANEIEDEEAAHEFGVEVYQARLFPENWRDRADWEVKDLNPLWTEATSQACDSDQKQEKQ